MKEGTHWPVEKNLVNYEVKMNELAMVGWKNNPLIIEADLYPSLEGYLQAINSNPLISSRHTPSVLIISDLFDLENLKNFFSEIVSTEKKGGGFKQSIILIQNQSYQTSELVGLINEYPIVAVIPNNDLGRLEDIINVILFTKRLTEQTSAHQNLLREQVESNESKYQHLINELADQQKKIFEMQSNLIFNLQQEKLLFETLIIIMSSEGLGQLELRLQDLLIPFLGNLHLRIVLHKGAVHPILWSSPAIGFNLYEEETVIGQLIVTPLNNQNFKKKEIAMVESLSETIALQIPRLLAYEANIALETEWRATFDAILDPLIIVQENYEILEANRAAKNSMKQKNLQSGSCYQLLFDRSTPCEFCCFGKKSNSEAKSNRDNEFWEMKSHELNNKTLLRKQSKYKLYIHHYRNIFYQKEMEDKLKENLRYAEVGVFKASLAHELNNPIGGLLTFAQLQKMDLKEDHPLFSILSEIERQAFVCRDLIKELLDKTRSR